MIQQMLAIWSLSGSSAFSKSSLNIWKFSVHVLLKPGLENFEHYFNWHVRWVQLCGRCQGKFGLGVQNEAGQRLIEFCQENALVIPNTLFQQHKRRLYTWTSPDVNTKIILIIFFADKYGETLYSQQKQDRELIVAQNINSLLPNSDLNWRKQGNTTRPFRYDLNQIPYDYTVEVRNRFKGLYLIDRVPDDLWTEVPNIVWKTGIRTIPRKRNAKKQNGCLGRPYK